jgi:hypothetical protein
MKKYLLILILLLSVGAAFSQGFPGTDSLRRYNIKYITNNPATAFTNHRLNTLLAGIIDWIDTAQAGPGGTIGVDTIGILNDSTIRYRKSGVWRTLSMKGVYENRRKLDTLYKTSDTTLAYRINNLLYTITLPGRITRASNGLSKDGDTVELGGTLYQQTELALNGNNLLLTGIGNVGIGATSLSRKLHVAGTGLFTDTLDANRLIRVGTTGLNGEIQMKRTSDGATIGSLSVNGSEYIENGAFGYIQLQSATTAKQYITPSGIRIGFNATDPFDSQLESAYLVLMPGDSTTNRGAPLKFTLDGARVLNTVQRGVMEAHSNYLMWTDSLLNRDTLATRRWARTEGLGASVTANNGLTKTGNNIQLGGLLTDDTFIEGNNKQFFVTRASGIALISEHPSDPSSNYAEIRAEHAGQIRLRNNLNGNQRTDILMGKQDIDINVDYNLLGYINKIHLDTNYTYLNSRTLVYNTQHGDLSPITSSMLTKAFSVFGSSYIRDTLTLGKLPLGNSSDSVVVWRSSDSTIRKVAQSSISGGGGGTPGGSNTQLQFNNSSAFGGTAGATWDATNAGITITKDALGVTQNASSGIIVRNTTAAAAGAQQISPGIRWSGNGWKTTATAASQQVEFLADVLPVQGSTNPSATWRLGSQINGTGGFTNSLTYTSGGVLTVPTSATIAGTSIGNSIVANGSVSAASTGAISFNTRGRFTSPSDGVITATNSAQTDFTRLQFGGTTSSFPSLQRSTTKLIAMLADGSARTNFGVLDEAYDATSWNENDDVPTKNAIRDKFQDGQNYQLFFSDNSSTTVANTAVETSLLGTGAGSAAYANITAGSVLSIKGSGTLSTDATPGVPELSFSIGNYTLGNNLTGLSGGLTNVYFEYTFELIPVAVGTNQDVMVNCKINVHESSTVVKSYVFAQLASGSFTTTGTPAADVTVQWNTADADNSVTGIKNIIEIFRK